MRMCMAALLIVASLAMTSCQLPGLVEAQVGSAAPATSINPADFVKTIDNPYLPFKPGTTFVYEGESGDGFEHIEVIVTHDTKEILGVTTVVVHDTVTSDGEVVEDTLDWYAQDKDGNVWYFGEDSKKYENGIVVSTHGSWEAGVEGALPGIIMYARPQIGVPYQQEYLPGVAEDMAQVLGLSESVSIRFGDFGNVLATKEWTPLEPGVAENKYYVPGVGLILEEKVEGGTGRVELVEKSVTDDEGDDETCDGNAQGDDE